MEYQLAKVDDIQIKEYYNIWSKRNNIEMVSDHDVTFLINVFPVTIADKFWILLSGFFVELDLFLHKI